FNTPAYDTGKVLSNQTSVNTNWGGASLENKTIKARVRVWDSRDTPSAWTYSNSWFAPQHSYPQVDFCWPENCNSPTIGPRPNAGIPVTFTDLTTFYDSG